MRHQVSKAFCVRFVPLEDIQAVQNWDRRRIVAEGRTDDKCNIAAEAYLPVDFYLFDHTYTG
ncbi:MAG: hypothetical protein CMJ19_05735 [Phycisphaeraceae bacterium]|nr:hypothetical protein [Phycisphaeraceae bacterium]